MLCNAIFLLQASANATLQGHVRDVKKVIIIIKRIKNQTNQTLKNCKSSELLGCGGHALVECNEKVWLQVFAMKQRVLGRELTVSTNSREMGRSWMDMAVSCYSLWWSWGKHRGCGSWFYRKFISSVSCAVQDLVGSSRKVFALYFRCVHQLFSVLAWWFLPFPFGPAVSAIS